MINIECTHSPTSEDIQFLTDKIDAETLESGRARPFGFFIRNNEGEIIAGANGFLLFGSIYTDQLWVHPNIRNKGYAKQIMEKVHKYGKESGCTTATLSTMSFQGALKFYQKLGYSVIHERAGHTHDSSCIFLKKDL